MSSTMWGQNPTLLACGHLAEPLSGIGCQNGAKVRECFRCVRERGDEYRWQEVVADAQDVDFEVTL